MLKIWCRTTSSNVMKVLWTCAELGLPFARVDVGGPFGGNRTPEYLAMNPNGLVPTLDEDGFVLWESNSIVRYLASGHGLDGLCPAAPHRKRVVSGQGVSGRVDIGGRRTNQNKQ